MTQPYKVTINPDRTVTLHSVPVEENNIDITLRPATRRDRTALGSFVNAEDYDERLLELLCIKFGKESGVNALALASEKYDEVMAVFAETIITEEVRSAIFRKPSITIQPAEGLA